MRSSSTRSSSLPPISMPKKRKQKTKATKHAGGRPRIFNTPEELTEKGEAWIRSVMKSKKGVLTITGLALALGLSSRQSLMEYERRPEFSDAVKRVKTQIEAFWERR